MKILAPIKGFIKANAPHGSISQYFGENPALYNKCPEGGITINGVQTYLIGHNGIDIVAPWYTPIYSVSAGLVTDLKDDTTGYGRHVRVSSGIPEGGGYEWTYGHLEKIVVGAVDKIEAGQLLGYMGNTGMVYSAQNLNPTMNGLWKPNSNQYYGTHLHLGCRQYDSRGTVMNYDNGYFGSFDFIDMLPDNEVNIAEYQTEKLNIFIRQVVWALGKLGIKIDTTK